MVNTTDISPRAKAAYERYNANRSDPLTVTSGYRSKAHNEKVGGAKNSQHIHGNAYDFSTAGLSLDQIKAEVKRGLDAGFSGVGFYDGSIHFDTAGPRSWGSSYSVDTSPPWLQAMVAEYGGATPAGISDTHAEHSNQQGLDPDRRTNMAPLFTQLQQDDQGAWVDEYGNPMDQGQIRLGGLGINRDAASEGASAIGNFARSL